MDFAGDDASAGRRDRNRDSSGCWATEPRRRGGSGCERRRNIAESGDCPRQLAELHSIGNAPGLPEATARRRKTKMKFFLDTASVEEIKKAASMGVLDGITTNPTLVAKEKRK